MWQIATLFLGNRWGQLIVAAAAAYFFGFYSAPRVDVPAIVRNAEAGRDAYWKDALRKQERESEARIEAAKKAAEAEPDTPEDDARRKELCETSPTCRERRQ